MCSSDLRAVENVSIANGDGSIEATVASAVTSATSLSNISAIATNSLLLVADPTAANVQPVLADNTGALASGKMVYTYTRSAITSTDSDPVLGAAINTKGKDLYFEVAITTSGSISAMDFRLAIETRASSASSNWHQIARLKDFTADDVRIIKIRASGGNILEEQLLSSDLNGTSNTEYAIIKEGPYGEQIGRAHV